MKIQSVKILLIYIMAICAIPLHAQKKNQNYLNYIDEYSDLAITHMKKYGIPASITLAQGLLESGAGMSEFVKRSNNHFGIKCHKGWNGATVRLTDDKPNECFRKYKKAEDSFEDHSQFLKERPRYSSLFQLDITDYTGWAKGLQECGYATDKAYANKLIKIIEDYELYKYDNPKHKNKKTETVTQIKKENSSVKKSRDIYKTFGLIYVIANHNDSFESIASDLNFKIKDLIKYNEVPEGFPLRKGDIVYLEKKKKKADKPYYEHVVQVGESMHSISQKYGIRLEKLYKMNKKDEEYVPEEGDVLKLR